MERREEDNRRRSETEGPNKFCGRGLKALPSDEYGAGHLNDEHGQGGATQDQEGGNLGHGGANGTRRTHRVVGNDVFSMISVTGWGSTGESCSW